MSFQPETEQYKTICPLDPIKRAGRGQNSIKPCPVQSLAYLSMNKETGKGDNYFSIGQWRVFLEIHIYGDCIILSPFVPFEERIYPSTIIFITPLIITDKGDKRGQIDRNAINRDFKLYFILVPCILFCPRAKTKGDKLFQKPMCTDLMNRFICPLFVPFQ